MSSTEPTPPHGAPAESGDRLSPGERSVLAALRQPGRKTVRAASTDGGVREIEVEQTYRLDPTGGRLGTLALVQRLLAEAPFQDITLSQTDGRLVSLRRVLRSRL